MKNYMLLFLIIYLFVSCENDEEPTNENENALFWTPLIKVEKGNSEATLLFTNPTYFTEYVGVRPSNPDYFNILISNDQDHFKLYKKIDDITTTSVKIEDLTNNKPYYFLVSSHKKENDSIVSEVLTTIPSAELKIGRIKN